MFLNDKSISVIAPIMTGTRLAVCQSASDPQAAGTAKPLHTHGIPAFCTIPLTRAGFLFSIKILGTPKSRFTVNSHRGKQPMCYADKIEISLQLNSYR